MTLPRSLTIALAAPLLALTTTASAAVVTSGCDGGDTCTMDQLTAGGSITAGSLRFDSFSVDKDSGVVTIDETEITLTGLDDKGLDPGPGFRLDSNGELVTGPGEDIVYDFSFTVTDVAGASSMKDGSLQAGNNAFGANDLWEVQARVPSDNFQPDLAITDGTGGPTVLFDGSLAFAPNSVITVLHSIDIDSVPGTGASLGSYTFRVSQVPIPAALPLMLTALAAVALRRRRRSD